MFNLGGGWNSNTKEFEADTERKYDWVYVVANMGYTKFDKTENIKEKMTNIKPYVALLGGKEVEVIGTMRQLFENFDRLIVVENGIIKYGVHPSIVKLLTMEDTKGE